MVPRVLWGQEVINSVNDIPSLGLMLMDRTYGLFPKRYLDVFQDHRGCETSARRPKGGQHATAPLRPSHRINICRYQVKHCQPPLAPVTRELEITIPKVKEASHEIIEWELLN